MGKPAYLHRNKWKDKKLLKLVEHCRGLHGHREGMMLSELCYHHFGYNGTETEAAMRQLLKEVYYYLMHNEGVVFGPVRLPPNPYVWCVAEQDWEKKQILKRWIRNADGNLRRFLGSPELRTNWVAALGEPLRPMLEERTEIKEASHQLEPSRVTCPHCQTEVFQAKFCSECGGKL